MSTQKKVTIVEEPSEDTSDSSDSYTSSDANENNEDYTVKLLLQTMEDCRQYYAVFRKNADMQLEHINRMISYSQDYIDVQMVGVCCKPPSKKDTLAESDIIDIFNLHFLSIRALHEDLRLALDRLLSHLMNLHENYALLDMSKVTSFILGDVYHKPLSEFINTLDEIFKYFQSICLKLEHQMELLDPFDTNSVEQYRKLLAPQETIYEFLLSRLTYCQCKPTKRATISQAHPNYNFDASVITNATLAVLAYARNQTLESFVESAII